MKCLRFKAKDLMLMPELVAMALQADGWILRSQIVWHKPNPMPESCGDRPTSAYEMVYLLAKSARYFWDAVAIAEPFSGPGDVRVNSQYWEDTGKSTQSAYRKPLEAAGRNARNVWTIATAPFSESHYATMPPELVSRCIRAGTSERGCCSACGAPWVRVTERQGAIVMSPRSDYGNGAGRNDGGKSHLVGASSVTTGWAASCACDAPTQPCTVLDCFSGAGTTLLVADRLQRHAVGIELNPEYVAMGTDRVRRDAPLLADIA